MAPMKTTVMRESNLIAYLRYDLPESIRNPNIEIRNKRKELNPNYKIRNGPFGQFFFWSFEFVSNFGFRIEFGQM